MEIFLILLYLMFELFEYGNRNQKQTELEWAPIVEMKKKKKNIVRKRLNVEKKIQKTNFELKLLVHNDTKCSNYVKIELLARG